MKNYKIRFRRVILLCMSMVVICVLCFSVISVLIVKRYQSKALENTSRTVISELVSESQELMEQQAVQLVYQKAQDLSKQVYLYLENGGKVGIKINSFDQLAVQKVGQKGYTCVYDCKSAVMFAHPNNYLVGLDMHRLKAELPEWWAIFEPSLECKESQGFYNWKDPDGIIRPKYMVMTPVQDSTLMVAATAYLDEFNKPMMLINDTGDKYFKESAIILSQVTNNVFMIIILSSILLLVLLLSIGSYSSMKLLQYISTISSFMKNLALARYDKNIGAPPIIEEFATIYRELENTRDEIVKFQDQRVLEAGLVALGQSTAILAHDVRKPFSIVKSVVDNFDEYRNNSEALNDARVSIDKSIKQVESMINDIMDFSREVKLETKPTPVMPVFDFSIRQVSLNFRDADIEFIYNVRHKWRPTINEERIARVFVNIISNGIEAILHMKEANSGVVNINTEDVVREGRKMLEIVIGNDGPAFDEDDVPSLFESFFTKGKKRGTGIGLASAHKIVALHNGTIIARNKEQKSGVEFIITLPASDITETINASILPKNIRETQFAAAVKDDIEIEKMILQLVKNQQNIKVLLLEDEALYRASVRNAIKRNESLDHVVTLYEAHNVDEALALLGREEITHSIVDIDLGGVKNGFDFLKMARKQYPNLRCMVHSNRCIEEDKRKAKGLGALAFVPKPLNIEHLVEFLTEGERNRRSTILLINDERALNIMIKGMLNEAVKTKDCKGKELQFYTANGYYEAVDLIKKMNFDLVFCDLDLGTSKNGFDVLQTSKELKTKSRFYIVSGSSKSQSETKALALGADGYLQLPVNVSDFVKIV